MSKIQLDERSLKILVEILHHPSSTIKSLQEKLHLSRRQIIYDLEKINDWLVSQQLTPLKYSRQHGFTVDFQLKKLIGFDYFKGVTKSYIWSNDERTRLILLSLLIQDEPWSLVHVNSMLEVSRNTALKDIKAAKQLAEKHKVGLEYSRQDGYHLLGSEWNQRRLLRSLVLDSLEQENGENLLIKPLKMYSKNDVQNMYQILEKIEKKLGVRYTDERLTQLVYEFLYLGQRLKKEQWIHLKQEDLEEICATEEYLASEAILTYLSVRKKDDLCWQVEQAYIALQLLSTNVSTKIYSQFNKLKILRIVNHIIEEFQRVACVDFVEKEKLSNFIVLHLQPAYFRLKYGLDEKNPLVNVILTEHGELHHLVKKCIQPLELEIGKQISDDESTYITMHIGSWLRRQGIELTNSTKAVVVCPKGIAISNLLLRELRELFPDILFLDCLSVRDYFQYSMKYDLVFSTVHLRTKKKCFIVKPILSVEEKVKLRTEVSKEMYGLSSVANMDELVNLIDKYATIHDRNGLLSALNTLFKVSKQPYFKAKESEKPVLEQLITAKTIQFANTVDNWEEAIRLAAEPLVESGSIESRYVDAMIQSIHKLGPYVVITPRVAIPHARPEAGVNQLSMSFLRLKKEVLFPDNKLVHLLFVLAAVDNESHLKALAQLSDLISKEENITKLINMNVKEEVLNIFHHYSKGEMIV